MKWALLIVAVPVAAALLATGGLASRSVEPRVGFVAYPGSGPTPRTLDGLAFVGATNGFSWGAFGIDAAAALGLVLLAGGLVAGGRHTRQSTRVRTS